MAKVRRSRRVCVSALRRARAQAPWYLSSGEPGLQHHKATNKLLEQFDHSADKLKDRYQRGKTVRDALSTRQCSPH
jgi:hypothetical protein